MELARTKAISELLETATGSKLLSEELRSEAARLKDQPTVPWRILKTIATTLREAGHEPAPYLHQLCHGSTLACLQPPAPKPPNPQLDERRRVLQARLEDMQYASMVSDITQKERDAEAMRGLLPNARLQLSYGAHVLVTMFTFFSLGYYGSKHYLHFDELWAGLLGALGVAFGLVMETTLLIIRTNRPDKTIEERFPELVDPARWGGKGKGKGKGMGSNQAGGGPAGTGTSKAGAGSGSASTAQGAAQGAGGAPGSGAARGPTMTVLRTETKKVR